MASTRHTADTTHPPPDAVSYGLDLDSTFNNFIISFSTDAAFSDDRPNNYVVNLDKGWKDDMGLHLLQRSMLPTRNIKCIITLTGSMRIAEDYGGAMKHFVKSALTDLNLDEQNSTSAGDFSSNTFVLQLKLADPSKNFILEDNFDSFDRRKFRIGGPAIQEVKARGFQVAERGEAKFEPIIAKCRFVRITLKDWQNITDPEIFSPEVVNMIGGAGSPYGPVIRTGRASTDDKKDISSSKEASNNTHRQPVGSKRPCPCWKRDGTGGTDNAVERTGEADGEHSDACESHWAALFGDYVQENKLKQARVGLGGMMASRWATKT